MFGGGQLGVFLRHTFVDGKIIWIDGLFFLCWMGL